MRQNQKHFQHHLVKNLNDFDSYLQWRCTEYRSQSSFFYNEKGSLDEVHILKIEETDEVNGFLSTLVDSEVRLPRKNTTKRKGYKAYFQNQEAIDIIADIYSEDIKRFTYSY